MSFLTKLFRSEPTFEAKIIIKQIEDNERYRLPYFVPGSKIFLEGDSINGNIEISPKKAQPIIHNGIFMSVIGQFRQKTSDSLDQFYITTEAVCPPGSINEEINLPFVLPSIKCPIPSYYGTNYDARYIIELKVNSYTFQEPIYFLILTPPPERDPEAEDLFKAEIGMQSILHIAIIFKNLFYDVSDSVYGDVFFMLVKIRIIECFFEIQRIETYKNGLISSKFKTTVASIQVIDGVPVKGDMIPVRIYMPGIKAWSYPKETGYNLNVKYLIRLLLVDENGKHYYKELGNQIYRLEKLE